MRKNLLLCFVLSTAVFTSCSKKESADPSSPPPTPPAAPVLLVNKTSILAKSGNYEDSIVVTANRDWRIVVTGGDPWLKLDNSTGTGNATVKISLQTNYLSSQRSATIKVELKDGSITPITVALVQKRLAYSKSWEKKFAGTREERVYDAIKTDGGYVMAGSTDSNDGDVGGNYGNTDVWIMKVDDNGNKIWQKRYGGSGSEYANAISSTPDGGFIVIGSTFSADGDVGKNYGSYDVWVIKLNKDGGLEWQKIYGGTEWDEGADIISVSDGYVFTGRTGSQDIDVVGQKDFYDCWVVKLKLNGELEWQKCYGGFANDYGISIAAIADGYIMTGTTESSDGDVTVQHGRMDLWVVKMTNKGEKIWEKTYGDAQDDMACGLLVVNDGYVVSGNRMVMKIDNNGAITWQTALGLGAAYVKTNAIAQTADGGYALTGAGTPGAYFILSSSGEIRLKSWNAAAYSPPTIHSSAVITTSDGLIVFWNKDEDAWFTKFLEL